VSLSIFECFAFHSDLPTYSHLTSSPSILISDTALLFPDTPSVTDAARVGALGNLVANSAAIQEQYASEVENRTENFTSLKNKGRTASKAAIGEFADIKANTRKQGALRREMSQAAIKAGDVKEVAAKEKELKVTFQSIPNPRSTLNPKVASAKAKAEAT